MRSVDVTTKVGELIDLTVMVGIEVGALHSPRLPRGEPNVRYLDHATKEELRAKYAENPEAAPQADGLVDVDYVWQPGKRLIDVIGEDAPLDFVIASHVLEHIPNPIGWLQQVAEILRVGGVLSLVLPDKRFCFDARRLVTAPAQLVDAYLTQTDVPTFQQIYDHESNFIGAVSAADLWAGLDPSGLRRGDVVDPDIFAFDRCIAAADRDVYVDVHCSTFTPASFVELYDVLVRLGLIDFEIVRFYPTEPGDYEFFVTLVKSPLAPGRDRSRARAGARELLAQASMDMPQSGPSTGSGRLLLEVSSPEARIIAIKRRVLDLARRSLRLLRR